MRKPRVKPNYRRRVLRLPDLDHCKLAVLNSLGSPASRRVYEYAWALGYARPPDRCHGRRFPSAHHERSDGAYAIWAEISLRSTAGDQREPPWRRASRREGLSRRPANPTARSGNQNYFVIHI